MKKYLFLATFFSLLSAQSIKAQSIKASSVPQVGSFIINMVNKHNFAKDELEYLFENIELTIKTPQKKTAKKHHQITWDRFSKIFLTEQRINSGTKFLKKHYQTLQRAEDKFGVQKAIIVAVLGVETNYGKNLGDYPTMKTLTALAFGNNKRQNFYLRELEQFLILSRKNSLAPLSVHGSHAGAMGMAQFISSSYNYYAIDFNGDGKADLGNPVDAIGSIANYLAEHYWQKGGTFATRADDKYINIATKKPNKPKLTRADWQQKNVWITNTPKGKKFSFITLQNDKRTEVWQVFWNFYAITRYNHDNKYAMAVVKLASKIIDNIKN